MDVYDVAQICLNGHVSNSGYNTRSYDNKDFCEKCGAPTIVSCSKCGNPIRGSSTNPFTGIAQKYFIVPVFCEHCGSPYPWTVTAIEAAKELAYELELLEEQEQTALANTIDDLVQESPKTQVAAVRFKRLMLKAGERVGALFKDILTDVLSETIKKTIFPT